MKSAIFKQIAWKKFAGFGNRLWHPPIIPISVANRQAVHSRDVIGDNMLMLGPPGPNH
jgi:hypothetical protein